MEDQTNTSEPEHSAGGVLSTKYLEDHYLAFGCGLMVLINVIVVIATIACIKCVNKTKIHMKDNVLIIKSFTCRHEICLQDLASVGKTPHQSKPEIVSKAIEINKRRKQIKEQAQNENSKSTVTYVMPEYDVIGPVQPIYSEIVN